MADTVLAGGGTIHSELVVNHEGPSLWLSLPRGANPYADEAIDAPHPNAPPILIIPHGLHIPVTNLDWAPSDTELAYRAGTEHLSDAQRTILDSMVALFNTLDKVRIIGRGHAQHSVRSDPELLALIRDARPKWDEAGRNPRRPVQGVDGASQDEPAVAPAGPAASPAHTVVRSRLRSEMGEGDDGPRGYFMPMIDMLNHHPYGSRYERTDEGAWLIRAHHPTPGDQVFVRYNKADALGIALGLGYFEPDTRFVASVACECDVPPIGRIRILGVGVNRQRLPAPRVQRTDDGLSIAGVELSADSLPTLRTLLSMPLLSMSPTVPEAEVPVLVDAIIDRIVEACRDFYLRLAALPVADRESGSNPELRKLFTRVARRQLVLLDELADAGP